MNNLQMLYLIESSKIQNKNGIPSEYDEAIRLAEANRASAKHARRTKLTLNFKKFFQKSKRAEKIK